MSKYIDADKLKAEIERLNSLVPYENSDRHDEGLHDAYKAVKNIIGSLQQEEQPEVDLEKELHTYICSDEYMNTRGNGSLLIARHFYELGLKARKEE